MEKVVDTGTCWMWTAMLRDGYGYFDHEPAHAWLYRYVVGLVPEGRELHHVCEVRACVNPAHLQPVTRREHCDLHVMQRANRKALAA